MPKRLLIKRPFDFMEILAIAAVFLVGGSLVVTLFMNNEASDECLRDVKKWEKKFPEIKKYVKKNAKKNKDDKITNKEYFDINKEHERLRVKKGHKDLLAQLKDFKSIFNQED